jgi:exo-beta-1,3-glucanase (GH17 family)
MAKSVMTCCRVIFVTVILVAIAGGAAAAIYFALRKHKDPLMTDNTTADSPETAKSAAVNYNTRNDPIKQENIFYGLSYTPYGLGDNRVCPPFNARGGLCLLPDQVLADVRTMSGITRRIKTYSLVCLTATQVILDYAIAHKMTVMLGVFVTQQQSRNDLEVANFRTIASKYAQAGVISDIMVGNEPIFVEKASVSQVVDTIAAVRGAANAAGLKAPIGTAEIYGVWMKEQNPAGSPQIPSVDFMPVVNVVDWIGLNTHPYYAGQDPLIGDVGADQVGAAGFVAKHFKEIGISKPVYITETGYPDAGKAFKLGTKVASPSLKGLQAFAKSVELAARPDTPVYFFEPFNGDWKRRWLASATDIDYHFGLFNCDRSRKAMSFPSVRSD